MSHSHVYTGFEYMPRGSSVTIHPSNNNEMEFTELTAMDISKVRDANRIFGKETNDKRIPILLRPGRLSLIPWITIPEGMYALVQSSGRDIDHPTGGAVWPPGLHSASPWIKVSHLVTKQRIVFNTPVKGCKTADDVTVEIDMTITFRIMGDKSKDEDPELVRKFVYNMGPASLQQQLADAQEEAARQLARSVTHDQVYGLRGATGIDLPAPGKRVASAESIDDDGAPQEQEADDEDDEYVPVQVDPEAERKKRLDAIEHTENMKRVMNEQFNQYGVQIVNVAITDVKLPESFAEQMQEKTTYTSVTAAQKMKQKNDMQLLRYGEEIEQSSQKKKEDQLAEESRGEQMCAVIQKEVDEVQAETRKIVSLLVEQECAMLREIEAESDLKVTQLVTEKETILRKLEAQAKAESRQIQAETMAKIEHINAQANLTVAKNEAKCAKIMGEAHLVASERLKSKRDFDLMNEQLSVYKSLANNTGLVISGSTQNGNLLANMLVAKKESNVLLSVDPAK